MNTRIAVYGLLRCGERLAHLLHGARFIGRETVAGFDLFDLGAYPAALAGAGTLAVEIHELASDAQLASLDDAEGVHEDPPLYRRVELGNSLWIYLYARPIGAAPRIPSGDWLHR